MSYARPLVFAVMAAAAACGGASDPISDPGSSAPALIVVQTQVFTPRCALSGCHVGTTAPFGMDLSSVLSSSANLIGVPSAEQPGVMRVAAYDSASSYLYWKVSGNPGIGGDRMPLSGGPLSDGDLRLIASWIDGGAK